MRNKDEVMDETPLEADDESLNAGLFDKDDSAGVQAIKELNNSKTSLEFKSQISPVEFFQYNKWAILGDLIPSFSAIRKYRIWSMKQAVSLKREGRKESVKVASNNMTQEKKESIFSRMSR